MKNHYDTLGVSAHSEIEVIHAAYKALMRKYHPDRGNWGDDGSRAREINEAFAILGDPERRREYDWGRKQIPDGSPAARTSPASSLRHKYFNQASALIWIWAIAAATGLCIVLYVAVLGEDALAISGEIPDLDTRPAPIPFSSLNSTEEAGNRAHRYATSFDCALARLRVEQQVCGVEELAARDVELSRLYDALLNRFHWQERNTLRASQNDWLATRNLCWTEACVANAYDQRIALLKTAEMRDTAASHIPSYDCDLAKTWAEEQICRNPKLSSRDKEMMLLHNQLRDGLSGIDFLALRERQLAWTKERDTCFTIACIEDAYDNRVEELSIQLQ